VQREEVLQQIAGIEWITAVEEVGFMPSELRNKEMTQLINAMKEGVVLTDDEGTILENNQAASKILSGASDGLQGRRIGALIELGPEFTFKGINQTIAHFRARIKTAANADIASFLDIYPIFNDHQLSRIVWVIRDIADVRNLVYHFSILPSMNTFGEIIYRSAATQSVVAKARRVAITDASVLISGESGTGKELLAKAVHMASRRRDHPFVAVNCAALPESLLESELFGYEEGSFTGSHKGGKEGLFEFADEGVLFLDEIGELPLSLQAKLLRVLQDQRVRRVGGLKEYPVDVRLITATNRNLGEAVKQGDFRADLYYRINVVPLHLPPLRDRKDDIPLLAQHFAQVYSKKMERTTPVLKDDLIERLMAYGWPGNVRELENTMMRSLILSDNSVLSANDLAMDDLAVDLNWGLGEKEGEFLGLIREVLETDHPDKLKSAMESVEREIMRYAFHKYHSSRKIGHMLGISNTAVSNKLRKYGIPETANHARELDARSQESEL
jgi:transcriptional regulator of aroF, aroG, tyrA and aromatic amino acid transport